MCQNRKYQITWRNEVTDNLFYISHGVKLKPLSKTWTQLTVQAVGAEPPGHGGEVS